MPTLSTNIATTPVPLGFKLEPLDNIYRRVWPAHHHGPLPKITPDDDDVERPVDIRSLKGLRYRRRR